MNHLAESWNLRRAASAGGSRFVHLFLPDDSDEAHRALVHLTRTGSRKLATNAGGEYEQARLHDLVAQEGFSHHPVHGAAPQTGFMASYHAPEGSGVAVVHHISSITPDHIAEHRAAIGHHLAEPGSYQGGWHDTATGDVYLDASKHHEDEHAVRDFAAQHKQKAYFHLGDFTERFMDPHQDPLKMKDRGAWEQRYSVVGSNPHPRWHEYSHLYPNTPEQDEHNRLHGSKVDTEMAGRPIGAFRSDAFVRHQLGQVTRP